MKQLAPPSWKHPGFKIAGAFVALIASLWLLVQIVVDKEELAKQLYAGVKQVTGYEAQANKVNLSFFPQPRVTLERFEIENDKDATTGSFFIAERVEVALDLMGLLTGEVRAGSITIVRPVLELEVYPDQRTNWDFLNHFSFSQLSFLATSRLKVEGGSVNVNNTYDRQVREYESIDADISLDRSTHDVDVDASFSTIGKAVNIKGILEAKAFSSLTQYTFGMDLDISEGSNRIIYKGDIGHAHDGLNYDGVFSFEFTDALPWVEALFSKEAKDGIFKNLKGQMPLQISGKAKAEGPKYAFTEIKIKSEDTSGSGQIISDMNVFPQTQMAFNFTALNADSIFDPKRPVSDDAFNRFVGRLLPKDASGSLDLRIDGLKMGGVDMGDILFMATLDGGELVINQAVMHMPGDTELLVFGIVKRSMDDSINFDGSMELLGKHMLDFAHAFGFDKDKFITAHDGEFRAKASMFLSRANSVISSFKLQAGTLLASGGMTASQEGDYDNEYTLRISGIKLDPFVPLLVPKSRKDMQKSDFEDIMRRLDWLDTIGKRIKLNLVLQNYMLSKTPGKQSALHLVLEQGKFSFKDSEFELGGIVFSGSVGYSQLEEFPMIKADMSVSSFNIEPFTARNLRKSPIARGNYKTVWSEDFFSFSYLRGYNSDLDIRIRNLLHPELGMQNARLVATSQNGKWDIKSFRGDIWDGVVKINGTLDVASIPSMTLSFALENIESVRLFSAFAGHENFLGKLSLNGQVGTSGINAHNWIKNARGTFVVLGQNIIVKGFDVSSMVQAIPSVRSVADVTNTVRVAMLRRHTSFALVEGGFYLDNGVFKTTELKLRAKHSIGVVSGDMDLVTWNMNCRIDFGLITLARGDFPSISILFTNSIDDPEMTPDTRSLESFIARKYLRP